jgi:hypothetical protein
MRQRRHTHTKRLHPRIQWFCMLASQLKRETTDARDSSLTTWRCARTAVFKYQKLKGATVAVDTSAVAYCNGAMRYSAAQQRRLGEDLNGDIYSTVQ